MTIKLEELTTFTADLREPIEYGEIQQGTRAFYEATGGTVKGPRLNGTIPPGGGDWLLLGADGIARLDVRFTIHTDDGAAIYVSYPGVLELNETVAATLEGTDPGNYGDGYYMSTPKFETGDPRYAWLNNVVCVAEGRMLNSAVEFTIYTAQHA